MAQDASALRQSFCLAGSSTIQRTRDRHTDAFHRCLQFLIAYTSIAQRHAWSLVTEQAEDDRQRDISQNGATGRQVTQVVRADIAQIRFCSHAVQT